MSVVQEWRAFAYDEGAIGTDHFPPTIPTDVVATLASPDVDLAWTPSTDMHGIKIYTIYRDGIRVGSSTTATFTDPNVPTGDHVWQVSASDPAGNTSSPSADSNTLTVTAPDVTPPTTPGSPAAVYSAPTVTFTWTASTDSESGLLTYVISINGADAGYPTAGPTGLSFTKSGLAPGAYTFGVRALDNATPANASAIATASVTIGAVTTHTPPPGGGGVPDSGAMLQTFFDGLPQGTALAPTIVQFPLNELYRAERTIQLPKSHLVIHGNGAEIRHTTTGPSSGQMMIVGPTSDISVDHLTIRGNQPEPGTPAAVALAAQLGVHPYDGFNGLYYGDDAHEGMYGWRIAGKATGGQEGCDNIHLDHCDVYNVWSDFWNFESHNRHTNCTLKNSTGHTSGRQGFVPGDVEDFLADNITVELAARHTFDIEPGTSPNAGVDGLTIQNSRTRGGQLGFFSFIVGAVSRNITLRNIFAHKSFASGNIGSATTGFQFDTVVIDNVSGEADWNNDRVDNNNLGVGNVWTFHDTIHVTVTNCDQDVHAAGHPNFSYVGCSSDCTVDDVSGNTGLGIVNQLFGP